MFSSPENQSGHRDSDEQQEIKSKNLEAQRLCQQVLTAGFFGFWGRIYVGKKELMAIKTTKHAVPNAFSHEHIDGTDDVQKNQDNRQSGASK
ncbi:hypothetical protein [Vibrio owensii]|uniref:hypothetical protein n=1 Tax=Vibrio owensii TaxID=696485 RepID=UPI002FF0CEEC